MTVTIDSVEGIGAPPTPPTIHVEGSASGCEKVVVSSVLCSTATRQVARTGPDPWKWAADLPNDRGAGCSCDQSIRVRAECAQDATDHASWSGALACRPALPPPCWNDITLHTPSKLPCVPAQGTAAVTFTATVSSTTAGTPPYAGPYEWQVVDLATGNQLQPYTAGGASFTFQFPAPGTYKVRVRVRGVSCDGGGDLFDADTISLEAATPCAVTLDGPQSTECTDGPPTAPQTYTAHTSTAYAGPYGWEVRKQNAPQNPIHQSAGGSSFTYQFPGPGVYEVTVSFATCGCPTATVADTVTVRVPFCHPPDPTGAIDDVVPDELPPIFDPPRTLPISCSALLVVAVTLITIGLILVVLGICLGVPLLWIIGAIIGAIGLLLFVAWAILCSAFTACDVMRTVRCVLWWIVVVVGPVATAVAGWLGGLPCGLAAAAAWGGWGALLAWLTDIMLDVGCRPRRCHPFGRPRGNG